MDWQTYMNQQLEIKKSFSLLKSIFEQTEKEFIARTSVVPNELIKAQQQDAANLTSIHKALQEIINTNNSVLQNPK